jgi:Flp pilus assembly protein TadG
MHTHARRASTSSGIPGQGLVEFALVIGLLVIIAVGVLDLGRVFFGLITITNASREGARYLTLYPRDNSTSATRTCSDTTTCSTGFCCTYRAALQEASGSVIALNSSNVSVTYCRDEDGFLGCDSGYPVRVTVTYNFVPVTGWFLPGTIPLVRSTEMLVP